MVKHKIHKSFLTISRSVLLIFGVLFLLVLLLSFTTLPYWGYYWLGTSESKITGKPDYIVLLGGGGMPSESNLMRAFYVHRAATEAPESKIVISIPGNSADSMSTARLVAAELISKGIDRGRFLYEENGTNTRSQAMQLQQFMSLNIPEKSILLVTSPEHMRRAVLVFKKAGFTKVSALPAFENAIEADLFFEDDRLGDDKLLVPDIGGNTTVRYQFWNHLKYEILIAREMAALAYYKLRGWI
ncbi:MAG TPA: hypothetical protein DHV48_18145 [Prolixibacteraceae bacterium]|nr:hypothetical protein [Prolixibacteraceae bacterium]